MPSVASLTAVLAHCLAFATASPIAQASGPSGSDTAARAAAVKDAFTTGFNGYMTYAYGFDELLPVTNNGSNNL